MDAAKKYIIDHKITNEYEVVKILMEQAEKMSNDGEQKKQIVLQAYSELVDARAASPDDRLKALPVVPMSTIITIINAFIYASKTLIAINKETGIFNKVKDWFRKVFKKK